MVIYTKKRKNRNIKNYTQKQKLKYLYPNIYKINRYQTNKKTNQFNLTGLKFEENELSELRMSRDNYIFTVFVSDKFGDSGLTAVAFLKNLNKTNQWLVENMLMSCRVFGRQIEHALIAAIKDFVYRKNGKVLLGEFIKSKKNAPAESFFSQCRFAKVAERSEKEVWRYEISCLQVYPKHLSVNMKAFENGQH